MSIKAKTLFFLLVVMMSMRFTGSQSQEARNFPFDPFVILKSWNYDQLIKIIGPGEEISGTGSNRNYITGIRYPQLLLGMQGKLEYSFTKDSISAIYFRMEYEPRKIDPELSAKMTADTTIRKEYNRNIVVEDSLRRDSVIRAVSVILGEPLSSVTAPSTEKNARHTAIWMNRGYSCMYKDYTDHAEVVFSLSTVPLWLVGEFNIPRGTEILRKINKSTLKMSWKASLLGFPCDRPGMKYSDIFMAMEFTSGQRYLTALPKGANDFLTNDFILEFAGGQRFPLRIPLNSISFLPDFSFTDFDGDGIPDAMIQTPVDPNQRASRYYLYTVKYKEPNIIFNTDELMPLEIMIENGSEVSVFQLDGSHSTINAQTPINGSAGAVRINPKGFSYLKPTKFNNDGSTNFIGGIDLRKSATGPSLGILEITYKHVTGGWEAGEMRVVTTNN